MRKELISDQELISSYLAGNEDSLRILVNRHKTQIYSSIYLLVKDDFLAEDIFQETFMKVIKTLRKGKYKERGKFLPWIIRIARNLVIDHFRKSSRMPIVTDNEGNDLLNNLQFFEENREEEIIREQTHQKLRDLIQELPPEQKEVLILRHYAELSFKEIADLTNVSINTALGRMRYALNNLRKIIEEHKISL